MEDKKAQYATFKLENQGTDDVTPNWKSKG
jgi:hypothetical protein